MGKIKFLKNSIRFRAVVYVIALVLGISLPLSIYHIYSVVGLSAELGRGNVHVVAKSIAEQSRYGLMIESEFVLGSILQQYADNEEIKFISVTNSEGRVIATNVPGFKGNNSLSEEAYLVLGGDESVLSIGDFGGLKDFFTDWNSGYVITRPIDKKSVEFDGEDELKASNSDRGRLGVVQVGYSMDHVNKILTKNIVNSIFYIIAVVMAAIVIAWVTVIKGVDPLVQMTKVSRKVLIIGLDKIDRSIVSPLKDKKNNLREDDEIFALYSMYIKMIEGIFKYSEDVRRSKADLLMAKDKAEELSAAKSTFISTVSHEIRTPMNGVLGMVELLDVTGLDEVQKKYVETIRYSGGIMVSIIDDILDFSKLENGDLELDVKEFDVSDLASSVVGLVEGNAAKKKVDIKLSVQSCVSGAYRGDEQRICQVFLNLVGNAVKFTEKGRVKIEIKEEERFLWFYVNDSGIGIPENSLETIFDCFTQVDSSIARRFGGSGLGLSICKKLVVLMGGDIGVTSQIGVGSTFWFKVPAIRLSESEAGGLVNAKSGESLGDGVGFQSLDTPVDTLNILVAEDNPVNQMVAVGLLKKLGHKVWVASNGIEAVEAVKENNFDLVLMDMQMPEMDGVEATEKIRALSSRVSQIPIIAMTANVGDKDKELCTNAGMNDFIFKPISLKSMERTIGRFG